jgi:hypothetical protein
MIDIYREKFREISEIVDDKNLSDEKLEELNLKSLHECVEKRSTYFYTDDYTRVERTALKILVKKYHSKVIDRIEFFRKDINKVIENRYYDEQITMQSLIFDKYIGELSHVLTWFSDIVDEINGDFDGLTFKGLPLDEKEVE